MRVLVWAFAVVFLALAGLAEWAVLTAIRPR